MDDRLTTPGVVRIALLALIASLFLAVQAPAQDPPIKIAVVDLELVVANSPGGQALQAKLETFQNTVRADIDKLTKERKDIQQRLVDGASTLSEEKLSELQKSFEDKEIAIRRLRDDKTREGQKLQAEGLRDIEAQLEPVFKAIRDENGYDLILNNVPGVVVMAGERVDITPMVIERLSASSS